MQENTWTDFVLWESEEDANNATTVGQGHKVTEDFYACIQMNTCRALISHLVKKILVTDKFSLMRYLSGKKIYSFFHIMHLGVIYLCLAVYICFQKKQLVSGEIRKCLR